MVNLRDGHLNLAIGGHYNFAVTSFVRAIHLMLNQVDSLAFPVTLKNVLFSDNQHINGTPHMGRSLRSL